METETKSLFATNGGNLVFEYCDSYSDMFSECSTCGVKAQTKRLVFKDSKKVICENHALDICQVCCEDLLTDKLYSEIWGVKKDGFMDISAE